MSAAPLSRGQTIQYAQAAGFTGEGAAVIASIAEAESGLRPDARNGTGNYPEDSVDRGILQINSFWHPEVSDADAYDPQRAFRAAYKISKGGTDFSPWVAFTKGAFSPFVDAYRSLLGGDAPPAQPASPAVPLPPTKSGGKGGGFPNPLDGVAGAISGLTDAITRPVADLQAGLGAAIWRTSLTIAGAGLIVLGVVIYLRVPERAAPEAARIAA